MTSEAYRQLLQSGATQRIETTMAAASSAMNAVDAAESQASKIDVDNLDQQMMAELGKKLIAVPSNLLVLYRCAMFKLRRVMDLLITTRVLISKIARII